MWERNSNQLPPLHVPTLNWGIQNLGICPDRGSSLQTFGIQDDAPTNWATQLGLHYFIFNVVFLEHFQKYFTFDLKYTDACQIH